MDVPTLIFVIVLVVLAIAGILVFVATRIPKEDDDPLQARLAEFSQRGETISLNDIELSQPFIERVIYPILRKIGEYARRAGSMPLCSLRCTSLGRWCLPFYVF